MLTIEGQVMDKNVIMYLLRLLTSAGRISMFFGMLYRQGSTAHRIFIDLLFVISVSQQSFLNSSFGASSSLQK